MAATGSGPGTEDPRANSPAAGRWFRPEQVGTASSAPTKKDDIAVPFYLCRATEYLIITRDPPSPLLDTDGSAPTHYPSG